MQPLNSVQLPSYIQLFSYTQLLTYTQLLCYMQLVQCAQGITILPNKPN